MKIHAARIGTGVRWTTLVAIAAVIAWTAGLCGQVGAANRYVPNEYIIHTAAGASIESVKLAAARMGAEVVCILPLDDTYLVRVGNVPHDGTMHKSGSVGARATSWVIESIEPNLVFTKAAIPVDTYWTKQWDMLQINMPTAWDVEKGSASVTVAVLDTGVSKHPELISRLDLTNGYDFVQDDSDPTNDIDGHGTHVSGTIAAQGGNGVGVCGVCWDNVKIMPVRVLGDDGSGSLDGIIRGLDWAMTHGAQVVNMSLGGPSPSSALQDELVKLANAGIIICASAGNDGDTGYPNVGYPAAYDQCIAVASTGPFEGIAYYSSYGPGNEVDIAAPGGDGTFGDSGYIWSTTVSWSDDHLTPTFGYAGKPWQGTSMACPHVAGAAALLLSNGVPATEVRSRLISTARTPKTGVMDKIKFGAGILNMRDALANATIRITKPTRGGTTGSMPDFKIAIQGVDPTSIKVYFDYSDLNDDGVPDSSSETPIINSTNISNFLNLTQTSIDFNWSNTSLILPSHTALSAGVHIIYATGTATIGGEQVSDWEAFTVTGKVISKGIHMFAFPVALSDRLTNTPSSILQGAKFAVGQSPRSSLVRWIAAPRSTTDSRQIGYVNYVPGSSSDKAWVDPSYVIGGLSLPVGGGYYYQFSVPTGSTRVSAGPAGSGYWLILAQDAPIDETFTSLDADSSFDSSKGYEMRLYTGWNMVGNPYGHGIPWRAALFTYRGVTKSLLDAESAGWVSSSVYGYGGTTVGYVKIGDRDVLEPYGGYWVYARVGGTTDSDSLTMRLLP